MTFRRIPPPTWWQRQKKKLGYWWRRTRSRIACWVLGIDHFDIKMKGTIKSWETNIQGLHLTLDGDIDLMGDGAKFTHNEGTVSIDTLTVGATYNPFTDEYVESDGTTLIGDSRTGKLKVK